MNDERAEAEIGGNGGPIDAGVPLPERPDAGFLATPPLGLTGAEWVVVEARWSAIASAAVGLAPGIGSLKALVEAYTGADYFTDEKIGDAQRIFNVIAAATEALTFIIRDAVICAKILEAQAHVATPLVKVAEEAGNVQEALILFQESLRVSEALALEAPRALGSLYDINLLANSVNRLDMLLDAYQVAGEVMNTARGEVVAPSAREPARSPVAPADSQTVFDLDIVTLPAASRHSKSTPSHIAIAAAASTIGEPATIASPADKTTQFEPVEITLAADEKTIFEPEIITLGLGANEVVIPEALLSDTPLSDTPNPDQLQVPIRGGPSGSAPETSGGPDFGSVTQFATHTGPLGARFDLSGCTGYTPGAPFDDSNPQQTTNPLSGEQAGVDLGPDFGLAAYGGDTSPALNPDAISGTGDFGAGSELAGLVGAGSGFSDDLGSGDFGFGTLAPPNGGEYGVDAMGPSAAGQFDGGPLDSSGWSDLGTAPDHSVLHASFDGGTAGFDVGHDPGLINMCLDVAPSDVGSGAWDHAVTASFDSGVYDGGYSGPFDSGWTGGGEY